MSVESIYIYIHVYISISIFISILLFSSPPIAPLLLFPPSSFTNIISCGGSAVSMIRCRKYARCIGGFCAICSFIL